MISYADIEAEILELLRGIRQHDTDSVTAWMAEDALCLDITGQVSGQSCRLVRRQLRNMAKRRVVMWKVIDGIKVWALNEGQFRGAPALNSGDL